MTVEINIPPVFQAMVKGVHRIDVNGGTVGECLNEMAAKYPQLKAKLFNKRGKLPHGISIYINGENAFPKPLSKPVRPGDKIYISHIVLGG
ncbi:MAG: MoaD/ThiS family protein [Dehalococcoidales bacterium]|nr:MoaD/ThiS family protein [Dehalococcoidales bacterium]